MFINDFQSSNEYRLHQVLHTLRSVHGVDLKLESSNVSDLNSLLERSELIKDNIVSESRFNTYNSNPEYAKHMLITEAVRLYLTEIAPKRQRRKVKESAIVDEDVINPAQDPNMQLNKQKPSSSIVKKPLKPGTVNIKNKATGKIENIPVGQVQSRQLRGDQVVADEVSETIDPALSALMQKYGVEPAVDEGNAFSGARQDAIDNEDTFNLNGETYDVKESNYEGDWGSSDWYGVMKGMDEYLAKNGITPENIEAAAEQEAEFYHEMMGYSVEDAKDRIISKWLTRRGFKKTMEESDDHVSNPNYHKLAKEHARAAKAAADIGDDADRSKHRDLHNYYKIKAGDKPSNSIVNVDKFMKYVEKTYIEQLDNASQINESVDHDSYQASMARSELYRNTKYSMDMLKMVHDTDEVQPWIAANLTKAADYLDKIYHYLDYYTKFEPEQLPEGDVEPVSKDSGSTGSIARQNLMQIVEYSTKLFNIIQPGMKLEGWVAMKLTTASDCVSSSKHYMEYQQFEKHAQDMLVDVRDMAEEGANMKKKSVKESVGQMLMSMMLKEDQDLAQAQTLLAAKALSDDLQTMAEKVAKMSVEDLMPLVDTMKEQFGMEAAEGYNNMMKAGLEELLKTVTSSKDTSDNAIMQLQAGGVPSAAGEAEPQPTVTPADAEVPAEPETDAEDLGAPELPAEEPLGRAKKDESAVMKGNALNEKWGVEMKTKEKDKGMWDGWSVSELKAEKKKLMDKESRSAAEQKKVKQLTFAIRAKQKDKWGKVKEGVEEAVFPGAQSVKMPASNSTGKKAALQKQYNSLMMNLKNANDARSEDSLIRKIEPVVKQLNALGDHAPMPTRIFKESKVTEKAPPGKDAEDFIKSAKKDFKDRYGDKWEEFLYRTAWKKFGPKSESYLKTEKMLEASIANKAKLEAAFALHKKQYAKMVNEGTVQDPLKTGYGLEGEVMVGQIGDLNGMITKLKEMIRAEVARGAHSLMVAEHNSRKAERLASQKASAPYGVIWETNEARQGKFFESEKLRNFWLELNETSIGKHQLVNPQHFDAEIAKLTNRKV